ncbi:hypothetical protein N9N03_01725, partial [Chlamydiia bacterium]|nr:hypothetical protein [Chlamydiia bacterium]
KQKMVGKLALTIFKNLGARLSFIKKSVSNRIFTLSETVSNSVRSVTKKITLGAVKEKVSRATKDKKINIISYSLGFMLSGSADLGKVISGGIYLNRKRKQVNKSNISTIKKNIIDSRIKKTHSELCLATVKFMFSATSSYITRAMTVGKYIVVEGRSWAAEMAKSSLYQTLGAVASFGTAAIDTVFLVRNISRDSTLKRCHDNVKNEIAISLKSVDGFTHEKLQKNNVLMDSLKTIAAEKQGSQTLYKNASDLIDHIYKGTVDLQKLEGAHNLNDARSKYLKSWCRTSQHLLHLTSIALCVTVGILFVSTPPGAVAGLIFGLSMGASGCKVLKFLAENTMFKKFVSKAREEKLSHLDNMKETQLKKVEELALNTNFQAGLSVKGT